MYCALVSVFHRMQYITIHYQTTIIQYLFISLPSLLLVAFTPSLSDPRPVCLSNSSDANSLHTKPKAKPINTLILQIIQAS